MFTNMENAFDDLYKFHEEVDQWFGRRASFPAVNVYKAEDHLLIACQLPGIHSENVDITLTGDTLTIAGKADAEKEKVSYYSRERNLGNFRKDVQLPFVMPASSPIDAHLQDGVLLIKLPVPEESQPRKIKISA